MEAFWGEDTAIFPYRRAGSPFFYVSALFVAVKRSCWMKKWFYADKKVFFAGNKVNPGGRESLFQGLEQKSQSLERVFQSLEHLSAGLEQTCSGLAGLLKKKGVVGIKTLYETGKTFG